jgi:hypothetical protein
MFAKMQRRMQEKDKPVEEPPPADLSLEEMWTMTREEEELERNRQKVLDGTAVNAESFALWKVRTRFVDHPVAGLIERCWSAWRVRAAAAAVASWDTHPNDHGLIMSWPPTSSTTESRKAMRKPMWI